MPELPDVEEFKAYLNATSLHQRIQEVDARDRRVLSGVSPRRLAEALQGKELTESARHGKNLFARIAGGGWLRLHFGMTGLLKYFEVAEEPEHVRLLIGFEGGCSLAYVCQRRLGAVGLVASIEEFVSEAGLGPDALDGDLDFTAFDERLGKSRAMIKSALMNQSVVAGIGNIASDEILFQAGVHPRRRVRELEEDTRKTVHRQMRRVLREAVSLPAGSGLPPEEYLSPHRRTDGECPGCGGRLQKEIVCGRTAWFCPHCQC